MILTAKLFIQGHPTEQEGIPLDSCDFAFNQVVDEKGMPVSSTQAGIINLSFASIEDEELVWWGLGNADKNGKIVFSGVDSSKAFKTLSFEDAHCIKYHEKFIRDSGMTIDLTISARFIELSNVGHFEVWPGYEPPPSDF